MTTLNFDATEVEPQQSFAALPKGRYNVQIADSEMKDTKAGTGQYLQLTMEVIDGDHAGRKLFDRLNLVNANKTAEEIARRQLSAVCHAVGVLRVADSSELHGRPFVVDVAVEKDNDGNDQNRVKGYLPAGGQAAPPSGSPFAKPAAAAAKAAPWSKSKAA